MSLTTDPADPRLGRGADDAPRKQNEVYLVLSEEERAKGFVRPVRDTYRHVGAPGPRYPLRDLAPEEAARHGAGYIKYEQYPPEEAPLVGRAWTQAQLDAVGKGCGTTTSMGRELSETYARDPHFYGSTYCCTCQMHRPVAEFVWKGTQDRVGS
jgi:hypothetical protein